MMPVSTRPGNANGQKAHIFNEELGSGLKVHDGRVN